MGRSDPSAPSQAKRSTTGLCGAAVTEGGKPRGGTCKKPKGWGTQHPGYGNCKIHGGLTQAGKTAAAREAGRQFMTETKRKKFGGNKIPNVIAEQILLEEVARSAAMVRYLEEEIGQWNTDYGVLDEETGQYPHSTGLPPLIDVVEGARSMAVTDTEKRAWLHEYREERKHMLLAAKLCIDAKISDRIVTMAEEQGRLFGGMLKAAFAAAELTPQQARKVAAATPNILRMAATGAVTIEGAVVK